MGATFRLTFKWDLPSYSHFVNTNSPSRLSSCPVRCMEISTSPSRLSFLSVISEEGDFIDKDASKIYPYPLGMQTLENGFSQFEGSKVTVGKSPHSGLNNKIEVTKVPIEEAKIISRMEKPSQFGLLLENLGSLEESFADSDVLKLERDILWHLDRLGALDLFNTCLSRTLERNIFNVSEVATENTKCIEPITLNDHAEKVIIRSGKKERRRSISERALRNENKSVSLLSLPSKITRNSPGRPGFSSELMASSNSKSRRRMIARNEAEMSKGVKMASELERIWRILEKETGKVPSLNTWAEAARLDKKMLQQHLHFGWYCRDELIRCTRSLVLFLAKSYKGFGVASEDLLQAGYLGVLQGAERFDDTKGYRFSTYVQYWIRKSMSKTVARHARGIQIPCSLSRAINQIHKARKTLSSIHGRRPNDKEIADFTGLPVAKVESASKCLRIVGSIDKKLAECFNAKYVEFIPDMSIPSPEETVMRQHMKKDIYEILRGLDSRERQLLLLRYGLKDNRRRSLEEVGRVLHVSKEWVRRLENKVLMKISDEETRKNLSYYANL